MTQTTVKCKKITHDKKFLKTTTATTDVPMQKYYSATNLQNRSNKNKGGKLNYQLMKAYRKNKLTLHKDMT